LPVLGDTEPLGIEVFLGEAYDFPTWNDENEIRQFPDQHFITEWSYLSSLAILSFLLAKLQLIDCKKSSITILITSLNIMML
jgi:hypothetical protein